MKSNVIKAIFWAISIMIGLIITDVIRGNTISLLYAIIGGIVAGIVDFVDLVMRCGRFNRRHYEDWRNRILNKRCHKVG